MRALFRFASFFGYVLWLGASVTTLDVHAASNCPDSTETLVSLFGWEIPADGWDVAVGANGFVYVTDPVNDRICRYSIYGGDEMCWDSPGALQPGEFIEPR